MKPPLRETEDSNGAPPELQEEDRFAFKHPLLYKHYALTNEIELGYIKNVIVDKMIWFNSPIYANDPFDSNPVFTFTGSKQEKIDYCFSMAKESGAYQTNKSAKKFALRRWSNLRLPEPDEMNQDWAISCFTIEELHPLMWSHYSSKHAGINIAFRSGPPGTPSEISSAIKVNYLKQRPMVNILRLVKEDALNAFTTKSPHWAYEKEYRLFRKMARGLRKIDNLQISHVNIGSRVKPEFRTAVINFCKDLNIQRYAVGISPREYSLEKKSL